MPALPGVGVTAATREEAERLVAEAITRIDGRGREAPRLSEVRLLEAGFEDMERRVPDVSKIAALTGWQAKAGLSEILADPGGQRGPGAPPPGPPVRSRAGGPQVSVPAYPINVFWSDEDGAWVADVPDLSFCSALGATPHEAVAEVETAIEAWLDAAARSGRPLPAPSAPAQRA